MKNSNGKVSRRIETHMQVSTSLSIKRLGDKLPRPIELRSPYSLRPAERNARTHSKKQIQQIADSMSRFGVINPVIVDDHRRIIAGHARNEAAKLLGLRQIPVIPVSHLNETEIRAYMLADNRLAEKAGWDRETLAIELGELHIALPEIGLDLGLTGFEPGEFDSLMHDFGEGPSNPADQIPDVETDVCVAQKGDLFVLGRHRVLVGDARDPRAYTRLMRTETADMAFLDPPYNVRVVGHAGGRGGIKHREFVCASGEITSGQFIRFLQETLSLSARHTIDGGITYVCMDWRHARVV
jgi:hypothetical protein